MVRRASRSGVRVIVGVLVAAVLILCWSPFAHAQAMFGGMGANGSIPDSITKRGLDAYAKILGLDKDQKETATTLLEGNQTATRALMKDFQAKMQASVEKMRDGDFQAYQKDIKVLSQEMAKKGQELEKGFFNDLKAILTEAQADKWVKVERYRRREQGLRFGFVSGSAVDLIAVVEKTKSAPAGNAEFTDTLERWELDVDKLLVAFMKAAEESQKNMFEGEGMFDMKKIEEMMRKFYDGAKEVRDLNRTAARQLAPMMAEDARARFETEVKRRSFPRVYKPSHTDKLFDAALGFKDLSSEQKESLTTLREGYQRDLAVCNEKWARATEEREDKAGGSVMVMMQGMMGGGDPNDPAKQARDARKELDDKTKEKLESILTADQKSRLPEKKVEPMNPMAEFMPDLEDQEQEAK
ncbi:MAG: hypothetical protein JSR77_03115 [Planctomycetes bacterium]|nr:hypothetical protein [Planctomycetota bacterium]